jgi:hypothetical protein
VAHVVLFALHRLVVNLWRRITPGLATGNLLGDLGLILGRLRFLVWLWLDKHLPESLRSNLVLALKGRGITEEVRDCLAQLLDGDGEPVRLVLLDHLEEGITVPSQRGKRRIE